MFTAKKLIDAVMGLAANHPDAVYEKQDRGASWSACGPQCFYTLGQAGGGVGCIFGQALQAIKPEIDWKRFDDPPVSIRVLLSDIGCECTESEDQWMTRCQKKQDDGETWSAAVDN